MTLLNKVYPFNYYGFAPSYCLNTQNNIGNNDNHHNNAKHNDTQNNDTKHENGQYNGKSVAFSKIILE